VAIIGAVLSYRSLYDAAVPTFGENFAVGFPLLVDLLILGASLQYVAGAKVGRPMTGWRLTAHAGVIATLVLNALAATRLKDVPWHVTAPAVWAVLVELTARQVLGEWRAAGTSRVRSSPLLLWVTAPCESVRTRLFMLRKGIDDEQDARVAVGVQAAAREVLRLALPGRSARRARKLINSQLRAGSLPPAVLLAPLDRADPDTSAQRPEIILRDVLRRVLHLDQDLTEQRPPEDPTGRGRGEPEGDDVRDRDERGPGHLTVTDRAAISAEDGEQERQPEPSHPDRAAKKPLSRSETRRRLAYAAGILQQHPDATGPEMAAELVAGGWTVSDRTAARIILIAREEAARSTRTAPPSR
jgi:hypothetical protein